MKKRFLLFMIAVIIMLPSAACSKKPSRDFEFKLNFGVGSKGCVDTFKNKITKDLVMDGIKTVRYKVPDDMMQKFKEAFLQNDIPSLPETVVDRTGDTVHHTNPSNDIILTYLYEGQIRTIRSGSGTWSERDDMSDEYKSLLRFMNTVVAYINETDTYKKLPESNGGYD